MAFRDDGDALLARNDALQQQLEDAQRELADKDAELAEARREAAAPVPGTIPAQPGKRRKRESAPRPASHATPRGLARQLVSVFTRAWVIVVFGIPALFGVAFAISDPSILVYVAPAFAGLATCVIVIDAFVRRCPGCRRLLGGKLLRIVKDEYGLFEHSWECIHCRRNWKT